MKRANDGDLRTRIRVSAVMPCLNEERSLGICIEKAQRCFLQLGIPGEVVVADNGSTDRSVAIAEALGARVVHEPRKGYGAALQAGIEAAAGEIVVMADADDSYDWMAMGGFIEKIEDGYDLVIGNRFKGGIQAGAMPPLHRYLGNPVLSLITRTFYRIPLGDFHCGMRACRREAMLTAAPATLGMEFATEMVICAAQAGLRIGEIPTRLYPDQRGRPPHLRSFRDGWRHLRFLLTYAPDYLYLLPGALLVLPGLVGLIALSTGPVIWGTHHIGIHYLALASLLFTTGTSLIIFGLLAKAYNYARIAQASDSLFIRFVESFTLEKGLIGGALTAGAGIVIDAFILYEWLNRGQGDMPDTIHAAFVATTAVGTGIQIVFSSFLLTMLRNRRFS
jgi:glycosyltransferase involved in cell wall biosynthesis